MFSPPSTIDFAQFVTTIRGHECRCHFAYTAYSSLLATISPSQILVYSLTGLDICGFIAPYVLYRCQILSCLASVLLITQLKVCSLRALDIQLCALRCRPTLLPLNSVIVWIYFKTICYKLSIDSLSYAFLQ